MNELIRNLQEREELSFEEAQYYLKKAGGDPERAAYLVRRHRNSLFRRFLRGFKETFSSFWRYRFIICRQDRTFVNIPFFVFFILIGMTMSVTEVEFFLLAMLLTAVVILSGSEMSLKKPSDGNALSAVSYSEREPNRTADFPMSAGATEQVVKKEKPEQETPLQEDWKEYSEIIIK